MFLGKTWKSDFWFRKEITFGPLWYLIYLANQLNWTKNILQNCSWQYQYFIEKNISEMSSTTLMISFFLGFHIGILRGKMYICESVESPSTTTITQTYHYQYPCLLPLYMHRCCRSYNIIKHRRRGIADQEYLHVGQSVLNLEFFCSKT